MINKVTSPCGNFSVWINAGGERMPVHHLSATNKRSEGYVESQIGKKYHIHYSAGKTGLMEHPDWSMYVYVDGRLVKDLISDGPHRGRCTGAFSPSSNTLRPLIFAPIPLSEDDLGNTLSERGLGELGTVKVEFRRARRGAESFDLSPSELIKEFEEVKAVSDVGTKIRLATVTQLGVPKPCKAPRTMDVDFYQPDLKTPAYTISMIYMGLELMRALDIVPFENSDKRNNIDPAGFSDLVDSFKSLGIKLPPKLVNPSQSTSKGTKRTAAEMLEDGGEESQMKAQKRLNTLLRFEGRDQKEKEGPESVDGDDSMDGIEEQ